MSLLQAYLRSPRTKRILNRKSTEAGFSLIELVVVIAVLAILSAVAIPAFVGVQANAQASAVKHGLVNGVKECIVRRTDNQTTAFTDAQSFASATAYQGYSIAVSGTNGCFGVAATATDTTTMANFTVSLNPATGIATKTCTPIARPGCATGAW